MKIDNSGRRAFIRNIGALSAFGLASRFDLLNLVAEAHGQGAALQINRFVEEGAARFDASTGRFTVDFAKLEASIEKLVHDLCLLQHGGDKAQADALLGKYAVMSDPMKRAMASPLRERNVR